MNVRFHLLQSGRARAVAMLLGMAAMVHAIADDATGTTVLKGKSVTEENLLEDRKSVG